MSLFTILNSAVEIHIVSLPGKHHSVARSSGPRQTGEHTEGLNVMDTHQPGVSAANSASNILGLIASALSIFASATQLFLAYISVRAQPRGGDGK